MSQGVTYMLNGRRIWTVATVSLMTLRDHYDGPVCLIIQDEASFEFSRLIVSDDRCGEVNIIQQDAKLGTRNASYALKPSISRISPFESTVQMDADTAILGDFTAMFPQGDEQAVVTAFGDWHTQGTIMSGRVRQWMDCARAEAEECLSQPYHAINTGVIGYRVGSEFTEAWIEMTARRPKFICDEIAVQLLFPAFSQGRCKMYDDRFNWSPLYGATELEHVRVAHFHGKKHTRDKAVPIWIPLWKRAITENWFGIAQWGADGHHDKKLKGYLGVS